MTNNTEKGYIVVNGEKIMVNSCYPFTYTGEKFISATVLRIIIDEEDITYDKIVSLLKGNPYPIKYFEPDMSNIIKFRKEKQYLLRGEYKNFSKDFSYSFNLPSYENKHFIELEQISESERLLKEVNERSAVLNESIIELYENL